MSIEGYWTPIGKNFLSLLVFVTCSMMSFLASADDNYRKIIPAIYDPSTPSNSSTLYGAAWGATYNQVTVTCYHPEAANLICAGGGDFDKGVCPPGTTDHSNFATIVQDNQGAGNCWYRKNFGLNGIVDARQCGVYGDGTHDDGAVLNTCLGIAAATNSASDPELQNALHIVSTGGGVILDNTQSIDIPPNIELTCGGTGTGTAQASGLIDVTKDDDYRIDHITNAIVLDPTSANDGPYSVLLDHNNSTFSGCNLIAGGGTSDGEGHYPNPYSPSIWYPYCTMPATAIADCTDGSQPHLRSAIEEYSAYNPNETAEYNVANSTCVDTSARKHCGPASKSVGIHLTTAENLAVRDVTVLGFGTCYKSDKGDHGAGKRLVIERLYGDCDTGISVDESPDETHFNTFVMSSFVNRSLGGGGSSQTMNVRNLTVDGSSTKYAATIEIPSGSDFAFAKSDTVWIATKPTHGAQSAAGRWTVANSPVSPANCDGVGPPTCQTLVLAGSLGEPDSHYSSSGSPISVAGLIRNVTINGVPPTAITGIDTTPGSADQQTLQLVAVGQTVTGTCIQDGTTVTDVWPAKGIVYMSLPATCVPVSPETIGFYDSTYSAEPDCVDEDNPDLDDGCAIVSAVQRFGDGFVVTNSGGVSAVNCTTYAHQIAFHFSTNANSSRFVNCATGENFGLPDQDIIGLMIDGDHSTGEDAMGDACGNEFANAILGQHRTVGIVVRSNCGTPNHLSGLRFSGNAGGRRNAVGLEVDAGMVALTNSDAFGNDNVFKADATQLYDSDGDPAGDPAAATLSIGNNQFPSATLYMSNTAASASTVGCGNTFAAPTPYLCAPSSFTQAPGGRLTLTSGQPVMSADVTGATTVYYAPYVSQQVPIYSPTAGTFGLADIGPSGLVLNLDSSLQLLSNLYDVYVETISGAPELCSGPAWSSSVAGSSSRSTALDITAINGVWVNTQAINCKHDSGTTRHCPPQSCTYVGTIYIGTTAGAVSQQFRPTPATGGSLNCLCLYNAYNHVAVTSISLDSGASYTYATNTWRPMRGVASAQNKITVVDGLGQMQIAAQLNDTMNKTSSGGGSAAMGIDLNSTTATPAVIAQTAALTQGTYQSALTNPAVMGLWFAQAMENAPNSLSATFGGSGFQQLSVQVAD